MARIEVVVPVYISDPSLYPIIERFFESMETHYPDMPIFGVDDASPYPCPDHWPIKLCHPENVGFTQTVNDGLKAVFSHPDVETVIVANDDLAISEGDLDKFQDLYGLVIASPRDTASSDNDRFGSIWGMTRETYGLLGPLNASYKHFFSDRDYYDRAKANNVQILKWDDVVIDHTESATYRTMDKSTLFKGDADLWQSTHLTSPGVE